MVEQSVAQRGYERRDVNVRAVMWFAIGLVAVAIILHLGLAGLYVVFKHKHPSPDAPSRIELQPRMVAPQPRLQTNPAIDLEQFRADEEAKLNSYGWVDRPAGVVRIPIERAMDLVAQRGLPTRGRGTRDASGKTPEQMRQEKGTSAAPTHQK